MNNNIHVGVSIAYQEETGSLAISIHLERCFCSSFKMDFTVVKAFLLSKFSHIVEMPSQNLHLTLLDRQQ